jgi:hypothetical protein
METNLDYPRKLESISEAPKQFSEALGSHFSETDTFRLLLHAPPSSVGDEVVSATALVITEIGWVLASENPNGGISVEQCAFSDTLFLELTSIVLWGQLKIDYASTGISYSAAVRFSTVEQKYYREAIDLLLDGIERTRALKGERGGSVETEVKDWPYKFRNEVLDTYPRTSVCSLPLSGRRSLAGSGEKSLPPAHSWSLNVNSY